MRRIVAIQVKNGVAVGVWALAVLCVPVEVRQTSFACDRTGSVEAKPISPMIGKADSPKTPGVDTIDQAFASNQEPSNQAGVNSQPARENDARVNPAQNGEVAAEQLASEQRSPDSPKANDSHVRLIVISIPDRRLALLVESEVVKVYPIAVGAKHSPSPEGEYTVINHSVNPTYRHKDKKIEPGKDNPLGTRWMGLSLKGYGIHGTNVQTSIGKAASHGCFRMKKKDVEELYELVQVGDTVSIRGQRDELTAQLFTAPAVVTAKNDVPSPAVSAAKAESEIASAAQSAASNAGGGGQ